MNTPLWFALLSWPSSPDSATALSWWALQFTPRVARLEEGVVLEVGASLRLFGGLAALQQRLWDEGVPLGLQALAHAPTALGALALARARTPTPAPDFHAQLDALPLHCLSATQASAPMLARLGLRRLGELRALPRTPQAQRFGAELLRALDQAYGDAPLALRWVEAPEQFDARLELPWRLEHAPALLHYAAELLRPLCAWAAARHAGFKELRLRWQYDSLRARSCEPSDELLLRTSAPTRDFSHLSRLLGEHLARTTLAAPVAELSLHMGELIPLQELSRSLLPPGPEDMGSSLNQLLERLSVRLGPAQVRVGELVAEHRPECMQRWRAWADGGLATRTPIPTTALGPQPTWLLDPPLPLPTRHAQPLYQGPLHLLAGPARLEAGWFDAGPSAQRDYYLARSAKAGLLWIYQAPDAGWFLQGVFA